MKPYNDLMDAACCIDGFGPVPLSRPASVAELAELVRSAQGALYPIGGGTTLQLGQTPLRPGTAVDMRGLDDVEEFPARDMTITVAAGITVARLQALLAEERLRLPVDVPRAAEATLGGALSANISGPRRYGYGTLRDYVIGISAVNDEGQLFKAGGRVVKNVAGYDLCKLLIGSLGTLGIITGATLKLRPLADEHALVCLRIEEQVLDTVLTRLHESRTRPVCLDLLEGAAAAEVFKHASAPVPDAPWSLLVGYEGNAEAVNWQVQQVVKELGTACQLEARLGFTAQPLWQALAEWDLWPEATVTFRASMLPDAVAAFCQASVQDAPRCWLRAHAGSGIVTGHWRDDLTAEDAARMLGLWRGRAAAGQGSAIVTRCPPAWKSTLDVWGAPRADVWLMRQVKEKFDPRRRFNPGRFVDGI